MENQKLIFLSIILILLLSSYLINMRDNLSKFFKSAAAWVIIFSCFVAGYGFWQDMTQQNPLATINNGSDIVIKMNDDGHFHTTALVNGVELEFLIDTGATHIVLTKKDARKINYDLSKLVFWGKSDTANGVVKTAPIRLRSIKIGQYADTNILAYINEGVMRQSLLGMSFLSKFTSVEIQNNNLYLRM